MTFAYASNLTNCHYINLTFYEQSFLIHTDCTQFQYKIGNTLIHCRI
jgi:hypothetical protein